MTGPVVLPTFFIIGAAKAGTTSLNNYLAAHPEISMADPREPSIMGTPGGPPIHRYAALFKEARAIRGDCSPRYSVHPHRPRVADHMAELVPDARLIYVVRDPVERTIATYAQNVVVGGERLPLEEAVDLDDPTNNYVQGSRYATQVERYLRRFDQDRMLVLDQDELRHDRPVALRRTFAHVGADAEFWHADFDREFNVRGRDTVQLSPAGWRLRESRLNRIRSSLPAPLRRGLANSARRVFGRGAFRPEVRPEFRERLADALGPEAERLRTLTGQKFAGWSV